MDFHDTRLSGAGYMRTDCLLFACFRDFGLVTLDKAVWRAHSHQVVHC